MAKGKVPFRMCIACRQMKPKKEMTRIVKNADGEIFADFSGKAAGRGAYICSDECCRQKLQDKKLLHKAFSAQVSGEVYEGVQGGGKS
ncbi:MAG: YlxR family protein [Clostridia bacterium]|nr:YlxR family protein [Clostridia bacterium]